MTDQSQARLKSSRTGLEHEFYDQFSTDLMTAFRDKLKREEDHDRLAQATGISNPRVIHDLLEAGVTPETLAALTLVPLIRVAWADRKVQSRERRAVLRAARDAGLAEDSEGYLLLSQWLRHPPVSGLFLKWQEYAQALVRHLPAEQMQRVRNDIIRLTHDVAEATGGFLGLGSISEAETHVIEDIEEILQSP